MHNLIRADIYRIIRGKALYITLLILLVNAVLTVMALNAFQHGAITFTMPEAMPDTMVYEIDRILETPIVNGVTMPQFAATQMENFIFFLLPVIIVVAGAIFSHGTVKNDLAWGVSRTKLYLSKLILSSALAVLLLVSFVVFCTVIAVIINGFGGPTPAGHYIELLQIFSAQLVMLLGFVGVGIFLAFTTKRTAAVNGAFIAFVLVPLLLLTSLAMINTSLERLLDFELLTNIMSLAHLPSLETREILRAMGLGVFFLVTSTLGGIALFRRAEIK